MFNKRVEDNSKLLDAKKLREKMVMDIYTMLIQGKSEDEIHKIMNEKMSDSDLKKLNLIRGIEDERRKRNK